MDSGVMPIMQLLSASDIESINVQICRLLSSLAASPNASGVGFIDWVSPTDPDSRVHSKALDPYASKMGGIPLHETPFLQ